MLRTEVPRDELEVLRHDSLHLTAHTARWTGLLNFTGGNFSGHLWGLRLDVLRVTMCFEYAYEFRKKVRVSNESECMSFN